MVLGVIETLEKSSLGLDLHVITKLQIMQTLIEKLNRVKSSLQVK